MKERELYVVFVKTKRARVWHPLEIYTRKSHARNKLKNIKEKWPHMDYRISIFIDN